MPIPWSDRNKNYDNTNIVRYESLIESTCRDQNIHYLNVSEFLGAVDLEDGLHPNSQGHQKFFEKVRGFLKDENLI